jgi:hypothetical protein
MQHAWNILSGRKGVAQENFHKAIAGYEPELAEHKLIPRDVIKNPDALKEYQAAYGVSVDASKGPDQAKAQVAKLPPGTLYHFTNPQTGEIVQRTRGAEQAPQEAPPAAAAPMGPFQQVSPPSKLQAMMSMKPGGAPVGQEPLPAGQLPSVQQMQRTGALPLGPLNNMQKTRASQADFARSQRINQLAAQIKNLDAQASAPVGAGAAGGQRQLLFAAQRAAMVKELMSLMPAALPAVSRFHLQQMP